MRFGRTDFLLIALLTLTLALIACAGKGNPPEFQHTPELLSLEMNPNPVDAGQETIFILSWTDMDGDMTDPTIELRIIDEDDETLLVPVDEILVEGAKTAGTMIFVVTAQIEHQGNCLITVADDAGHVSEEIEEYLYVNPPPGTEE